MHERADAGHGNARSIGNREGHRCVVNLSDIERRLGRIEDHSNRGAEAYVRHGGRFTLLNMLFRPPLRFLGTFVFRLGVLNGSRGFIESLLDAYEAFITYAKAWELCDRKKPK